MPAPLKRHTWLNYYMFFIAFLAFFSLVIKPGLGLSSAWAPFWLGVDILIMSSFILSVILRFVWATNKRAFLSENKTELVILFLFVSQFIISLMFLNQPGMRETIRSLGITSLTKLYILFAQIFIFLELLGQLGRINARIASIPLPPPLIFMGSFAVVIIVGTLLLLLPGATHSGIKLVDALFTATSATCVTGLIVVPTGSFFTTYGHTIIMILIQIGGLGLMTFAMFSALILRGYIGIKEHIMFGDFLNINVLAKIKSLVGSIIGFTVFFELVGAILLYIATGTYSSLAEGRTYFALFHSVSAFCNAGFSLWDDNLVYFVKNTVGSLTIMGLIVFGGIGFVVLTDFWTYLKKPFKHKKLKIAHFSLHTKLVVSVTAILILVGAVLFYLLESNKILAGLSTGYKILAAFFQSITPRTAGFNSVDIGSLSPATLFVLMILMFIGASPGSTGGGIKTTTFGVLVLIIISRLRGQEKIHIFGRSIPTMVIRAASMVLFLGLAVVVTGTFLLLLFEPDIPFIKLLFEEISAFATVGLSTGITPQLSTASKIVIIITMFLGRIGPLTFITAVAYQRKKMRIDYPSEDVMIG